MNTIFPRSLRRLIKIGNYTRPMIHSYLRHWCADVEIRVETPEGFQMWVSPADEISFSIFFFGMYDELLTWFIKTHIAQGSVCWDVGAERGWYTLLLCKIVGPQGRVDGFEAFPTTYKRLVRNVAMNAFEQATTHNVAVTEKSGQVSFIPPLKVQASNNGVGYVSPIPVADSITVPAISLDEHSELTGLTQLDFIKFDIEGSEVKAIKGAQHTIKQFRPQIAVEYHRSATIRSGTSIEELDDLLASLDYKRYVYDGGLKPVDLRAIRSHVNVFCFPKATE